MTSIERTAYPRFGRLVTARELEELSPTIDELDWARAQTRSDAHLLALVVSLKCGSSDVSVGRMTRTEVGWDRPREVLRDSTHGMNARGLGVNKRSDCHPPAFSHGAWVCQAVRAERSS
jgi:hypothetical protein